MKIGQTNEALIRDLISAHQQQLAAADEVRKIVYALRGQHRRVSWADIGGALGMTAQGAQQRYAKTSPVERRRS